LSHQPSNGLSALLCNEPGRFFMHQASASFLSILNMAINAVIFTEDTHNAPLSPSRGGFFTMTFSQDHYWALCRHAQSHHQARKAGAHHHHWVD
jgi:hypothetical protein